MAKQHFNWRMSKGKEMLQQEAKACSQWFHRVCPSKEMKSLLEDARAGPSNTINQQPQCWFNQK